MKEFKGKVFGTSNNPAKDEYGKFIFRWDENKVNVNEMCAYDPNKWEEYGLIAYQPEYTRHQEDDWTVITLI